MRKKLNKSNLNIRIANKNDIPEILKLVKELADYERLGEKVSATKELFEQNGFGENSYFKALIAEYFNEDETKVTGFALFFFTFSTFLGKPTLYLEDLFIKPIYRGMGVGFSLLKELARIAMEKECGRMEWAVLDWNKPAINFYKTLGSKSLSDWTVFRLEGMEIQRLSYNSD